MEPSRSNPANSPLVSDRDLGRIRKLLWGMISTIKGNIDRFGKNATRKTRESMTMHEEIDGNVLKFGIESDRAEIIEAMETGVPPRTVSLPSQVIFDWSIAKGISFNFDYERSEFAYFVTRKIWREGTEQYRKGRNKNIYSTVYKLYEQKIRDGLIKAISQNLQVWAKDKLSKSKAK